MRAAIFGAGATGCYLGGRLSNAGINVTLICREKIKQAIEANNGIGLSDYLGNQSRVMPNKLVLAVEELKAAEAIFDVVFVMLKCQQVNGIAQDLLNISDEHTDIIFMQNGIGSFDDIKSSLPARKLYQGVTSFNVLAMDNCVYHQGTEGGIVCQSFRHSDILQTAVNQQHEFFECVEDIRCVIYSKLLLNLNNALNAIANLPLKEELEHIKYRKVLAGAMREWLAVVKHEQIALRQFTQVKPYWIPRLLTLPNWLFTRIAKQMLTIDPKARSSMWQDIHDGKITEVDYLNGAVVKLAKNYGIKTPINSAIVQMIKQLEQGEVVDFDLVNFNN